MENFKPFTNKDLSASERKILELLKITFSGFCIGWRSFRSLLNLFSWISLQVFIDESLPLRKIEQICAKSII